ncbi:hypothetical protein GH714_009952 [Hevea brasiliensis]|uniref:Uncharacterized protein n=1 Tax=Hevea brasiliensis TaxID=3981 RepID=A0A6A6KQH8_HEVBR|nr:hypothetical protein GH714_009952 [Hevea brasiliensis]
MGFWDRECDDSCDEGFEEAESMDRGGSKENSEDEEDKEKADGSTPKVRVAESQRIMLNDDDIIQTHDLENPEVVSDVLGSSSQHG